MVLLSHRMGDSFKLGIGGKTCKARRCLTGKSIAKGAFEVEKKVIDNSFRIQYTESCQVCK